MMDDDSDYDDFEYAAFGHGCGDDGADCDAPLPEPI